MPLATVAVHRLPSMAALKAGLADAVANAYRVDAQAMSPQNRMCRVLSR